MDHSAAIERHTPDEICAFVQRNLFVTLMFFNLGLQKQWQWIDITGLCLQSQLHPCSAKRAWQYYNEKGRQRVQWCVINMSFQVKASVLYVL